VLTEHHLRSIIENPEANWQIAKWAVELNPYGIKYEPRTVIKGRVLAHFVAEFTQGALTQSDSREGWILNIDGASNNMGHALG